MVGNIYVKSGKKYNKVIKITKNSKISTVHSCQIIQYT